jgi:hypothetical protein
MGMGRRRQGDCDGDRAWLVLTGRSGGLRVSGHQNGQADFRSCADWLLRTVVRRPHCRERVMEGDGWFVISYVESSLWDEEKRLGRPLSPLEQAQTCSAASKRACNILHDRDIRNEKRIWHLIPRLCRFMYRLILAHKVAV